MFNYILRRCFYSIWVIVGVLALTFILFNMSAGDPAAAVLGKNALPEEIENFRQSIGGDLPLFFGKNCKTEAFTNWKGESRKVIIGRNFKREKIVAKLTFDDKSSGEITIADDAKQAVFNAPGGKKIVKIEFFHQQKSPWNSQLKKSLSEIVSFKSTFPYVTFFNFGTTLITREPINDVILRGMGPSLSLMLPIFTGEIICGIIFALLAVACVGTMTDRTITLLVIASMSVSYLTAIIFGQWLLGYHLEWFPIWGYENVTNYFLPVFIGIAARGATSVFSAPYFSTNCAKNICGQRRQKDVHPLRSTGNICCATRLFKSSPGSVPDCRFFLPEVCFWNHFSAYPDWDSRVSRHSTPPTCSCLKHWFFPVHCFL